MFTQQGQDDSRAVARALTTQRPRATARALRPVRSVLAASAIAATALAGAAAFGGTAASAASIHPARPAAAMRAQRPGHDAAGQLLTGVIWQPLTLINGWQSAQGQWGTGDPAWAVKNGTVYLSGSMRGGSNYQFATLPPAARPAHTLWITVYTYSGTTGFLTISPDGTMNVDLDSSSTGNAVAYTSLAGVSFPAAATAATPLTLLNGWQSDDAQWGTGNPAYRLSDGVVHLSGSLHQPSGTNGEFAVLPKAARPAHVLWITVYTYGGSTGTLEIEPNGDVFAQDGFAQDFTSIAGVSYPAAAVTQHPLALSNGWKSQPSSSWNTGTPSYAVTGGVVYLSGSIHQPTGSNVDFAVLPVGARPAHNLYLKVYNSGTVVGVVEIDANGQMSAWDTNSDAPSQAETSVSALSFPVNS